MHRLVFKTLSTVNNLLFRVSSGRLGSRFFGAPVLLLTVRGRKSGKPFTTPLLYLQDGGDLVVVASKGGDPRHPDWYLNLEAQGRGVVELPEQRLEVTASTVPPQEHARLWPRLVAMYRSFDDYQRQAGGRTIPVVRLTPCVSLEAQSH